MDTIALRKQLHKIIDDAGEEKLQSLYDVIHSLENAKLPWWKDDEVLYELDSRMKSVLAENEPTYTLEDVDRTLDQLRKKRS